MDIERPLYLNKLISKKDNGRIKIITGIRRCGKSHLLFKIYKDYLKNIGILDEQIIELILDDFSNLMYRNPFELDKYIRNKIKNEYKKYYVFIDEIQLVNSIQNPYVPNGDKITFIDVVMGLMKIKNVDLYITGSNSKMLSTDILTQFRDRSDEIRVYPLSFKEFYSVYTKDKRFAFEEYCIYGGLPFITTLNEHKDKSDYLLNLFTNTYLKDVIERNNIRKDLSILEDLMNIVASSIGSLTNPARIANTLLSEKKINISQATISSYLEYFSQAFLISSAKRYDVKGRKYIGSPLKYYFTDLGLRNAKLNFRQIEFTHIMENIIYNELLIRGFNVDVGVVEYNYKKDEKSIKTNLEIDFVVNNGNTRYYIQSALSLSTYEKVVQETKPLTNVNDYFKKIVVVKDNIIARYDDKGIYYVGIEEFLLNKKILD